MYEDIYIVFLCQKNNKLIDDKILNISNIFNIGINKIHKYYYNFDINIEEIEKQKKNSQIQILKKIKKDKEIISNYKYIWLIDEDIEFVTDAGIIWKHNFLYAKYHYTRWNILYLEGKTLTPMYRLGYQLFKSFMVTDSYCYVLKMNKIDLLIDKYRDISNKNSIRDNIVYSLLKPIIIYPNICYSKICDVESNCYTTEKKQLYHNNFYYYSFILLITLVLLMILTKRKRLRLLLFFMLFILLIPGMYSLLYFLFITLYYLSKNIKNI